VSYGPKGAAAYLEENGFLPSISSGDGAGGPVYAEIQLEVQSESQDRFRDDKEVCMHAVLESSIHLTVIECATTELVLLCASAKQTLSGEQC
jgi:hypothetical protein